MNSLFMLLADAPNYTVTRVEENTTTITILYIILLIGYIVGCYFFNNSKKVDYTKINLDNFYLGLELVILPTVSALLGINYLCFSIFVLYFYYINIKYINMGYSTSIHTQEELVRTVVMHYIKYIVIAIPLSVILGVFCGFTILAIFFIFILACLLAAFLRIMYNVKEEETYKLMTNDAIINKLGKNFNTDKLFRLAFQYYIQIQKSLTSNTIDQVSYLLEPDMLAHYKSIQASNVSKKLKDIIEEESYISGGLINYIKTGNIDTYKVAIIFNAKRYKANIETGSVVEGTSMHLKKYTYLLDFNVEEGIFKLAQERKFKEE